MTQFFQPATSPRLNLGHLQQANPGECLATCTAMVLAYYNVAYDYPQLLRTLRIQPDVGTPFPSIVKLTELGFLVGYRENGTLEILHRLLTQGWPCLIAVDTGELPYWQTSTGHAVVLVGVSKQPVYLNDPEMTEAPLQVPTGDFYLAWQEHAFRYAVLAARQTSAPTKQRLLSHMRRNQPDERVNITSASGFGLLPRKNIPDAHSASGIGRKIGEQKSRCNQASCRV